MSVVSFLEKESDILAPPTLNILMTTDAIRPDFIITETAYKFKSKLSI